MCRVSTNLSTMETKTWTLMTVFGNTMSPAKYPPKASWNRSPFRWPPMCPNIQTHLKKKRVIDKSRLPRMVAIMYHDIYGTMCDDPRLELSGMCDIYENAKIV